MKRSVVYLCLLVCLGAGDLSAQTAKPKPCPFTPAQLSAAFGQTFAAGVEEPGISGGVACAYKGSGVTLHVITSPIFAPTVEQSRKFMNPPGTKFVPVAGDPDKALTVEQTPSVPPFPSISYERGGMIVDLHISGQFSKSAPASKADVTAWNAKLLKLPRVP